MTPNQIQKPERESTDASEPESRESSGSVERTVTVGAPLPATLASPRSKLVYLYLRTAGGGSAADLCDALGMKRVAAYPVLDTLVRRGLVVRDDETFYCS